MAIGYCTVDDLRRALRKKGLSGDAAQDSAIATDAIEAQSEPLEKALHRHWYEPDGIQEASDITIPAAPKTRDDEHDLPSNAGYVIGNDGSKDGWTPATGTIFETGRDRPQLKEQLRLASGTLDDETIPTYTRIRLARKDVDAVNKLSVINETGGYDEWVASSDYDGGVGNSFRGDDYWVRVNNGGVSELYLDVHAMDDDIPSFSNAVYVDIDYGHEGIPMNVRRAVAMLAGADLVEEAVIEIPQNTTLYNIETKADEMRATAESLLSPYHEGDGLDIIPS